MIAQETMKLDTKESAGLVAAQETLMDEIEAPYIKNFRLTKWDGDPPAAGETKVPVELITGEADKEGNILSMKKFKPDENGDMVEVPI